jgi:hypothetical protein
MSRIHIIYIPGLADRLNRRFGQATALTLWNFHGIRPHYFTVGWADQHESFEQKLQRLLKRIDNLEARDYKLSLVAASAGASLALIAFCERPQAIQSVATICGKLHNPDTIADAIYAANPALKASLERFTEIEPSITPDRRRRVLTVLSNKDNLVPAGDSVLDKSKIEQLPTHGHIVTIFAALTWYRRRLISFIRQGASQI